MAAVDERSGLPSLPDHGCCPFCNWSRKPPNKQPDDAFNEQQHAAREALHAGDRKSGDEKAALVRAIFAQCLVLLALREFALCTPDIRHVNVKKGGARLSSALL